MAAQRGGYLVSREEFLREEALRVINVVLSEKAINAMDLVALLTSAAERAILEKVNKDTWVSDKHGSNGERIAQPPSIVETAANGEVEAHEEPASADAIALHNALQAAADSAKADVAASDMPVDAPTPERRRASFANKLTAQRLARHDERAAASKRKSSKPNPLAAAESFSLMTVNNRLDPAAASPGQQTAAPAAEDGFEAAELPEAEEEEAEEEEAVDSVSGLLGRARMAEAKAWLEPWRSGVGSVAAKPRSTAGGGGSKEDQGAAWELDVSSDALAVE